MTVTELLTSDSYVDADRYVVRRLIEIAQKYNITAEVRTAVGRICFRDLSHDCLVHDAQVNDVGLDSVIVIIHEYETNSLTTKLSFKLYSNPTQEIDDGADAAEPHGKYALLHMDRNPSFILKNGTDLSKETTRRGHLPVICIDLNKMDAYLAKFMHRMDDLDQKWHVACIQHSGETLSEQVSAE